MGAIQEEVLARATTLDEVLDSHAEEDNACPSTMSDSVGASCLSSDVQTCSVTGAQFRALSSILHEQLDATHFADEDVTNPRLGFFLKSWEEWDIWMRKYSAVHGGHFKSLQVKLLFSSYCTHALHMSPTM